MKKNILSMAALLIASAAVFTACSSDDNVTSEQPANPTGKYTMTVQASKDGDATTRALTLDETTSPHKLNATWNENEEVLVYQNGSQIGTLYSAESATSATTLTGTLDSAPDKNQDLTLHFHTKTPSYTGQDGKLATIASTYDFCVPATITAGSFTVSGNTVSTTGSVSFGANRQFIVKFTLKDKNSETLLNAGTVRVQATAYGYSEIFDYVFTFPDDTYTTNGDGVIYLAIPNIGSYLSKQASLYGKTLDDFKSYCRLNITATVGDDTYTYTKSGWPFEDGKYYEITVKMTKQAPAVPDGVINGKFSVSDTKQVYFSKGNLKYNGSAWSFFDNQYDYLTNHDGTNWDKFGWSTSATTYGMHTSTDASTYSGDFKDWGETMGTGWRTLSIAEWQYLFNTRSASTVNGTADGRYAKAKVNDVHGMILFPDTYTHPDGVTAPKGVNATDNTGWNGNNYSSADWTKMESAGCVFLPAAGFRDGSSLVNADTSAGGNYWSAASYDAIRAYNVSFTSGTLNLAGISRRYYGSSVRLVWQVTE